LKDDNTLGNCIGLGAQILTGCINNPLYVMCEQVDIYNFIYYIFILILLKLPPRNYRLMMLGCG